MTITKCSADLTDPIFGTLRWVAKPGNETNFSALRDQLPFACLSVEKLMEMMQQ
jgi:hypothetical protein